MCCADLLETMRIKEKKMDGSLYVLPTLLVGCAVAAISAFLLSMAFLDLDVLIAALPG